MPKPTVSLTKQIRMAEAKLTAMRIAARAIRYAEDEPKNPQLFDQLFLSLHQRNLCKKLNAREQRAYSVFLRSSIAGIRRWAMEVHLVPREAVTAITHEGMHKDLQAYFRRSELGFIRQVLCREDPRRKTLE